MQKTHKQQICFGAFYCGVSFNSYAEAGRYLGVSRQAIHSAWKRKAKTAGGKPVIWIESDSY